MQKVDIIKFAKKIKKVLKNNFVSNKKYVSYSRRIERIKTDKRICAMTFDDGPTTECNLTETLIDILNKYNAKGTFDVIGTTEKNYPDTPGKIGTPSWSGTKYDHYPCFEKDKTAGAINCHEIIEKIIKSGHEITNHTYSHILFGKKNIIYSSRSVMKNFDSVYNDIKKLHCHLEEKHGYSMKFSRPPHYVDKIKGGLNSYDAYSLMGYNYLAASFDGAGWLPCDSENEEIDAMVRPLEIALKNNPNALCGQIIFQKDGYNMALRAPVMKGLEKQLEVLYKYGYSVVTVSELLRNSPFADINSSDPDFEIFNKLQKTRAIVFNDNYLRPESLMTRGELSMFLAPKDISVNRRIEYIKENKKLPYSINVKDPYSTAMVWAIENEILPAINNKAFSDRPVTHDDICKLTEYFNTKALSNIPLTRRNILKNTLIK